MFASADQHKSDINDPSAVVANPFEEKKQPNQCRDPLFAVLFYVNIVVIIAIAAIFGANPFTEMNDAGNADDQVVVDVDWSPFLTVAAVAGAIGLVLSCLALQVLMCIPGILIKVSLFFNIALSLLIVVYAVMNNIMGMAIFGGIIFLLSCCYTYCVWSRIPFATANLKTGCTAVRANCGVSFLAYAVVIFSFAWSLLWTVALLGVQDQLITCEEVNGMNQCSNPNYLLFFLLFISYFFTNEVLKNTIHTSVAGVVGSWWFVPDENGFCGKTVCGSFYRTLTTSFGSICFGSLIVAIIQALRQIVHMAKDNDDIGPMIACCIDCILSCIEGLVEYFNKWAFVYVGLYGYGYCEAGKNVMTLFRDRGWDAIIADDLVGSVLGLLSMVTGLITAGVSVAIASSNKAFEMLIEELDRTSVLFIAGLIGFIIGFFLCAIVMGVIASSVNATIVLFAEAPTEFETHYPELSREMRAAYVEAYPGCM